MKSLQYGQLLEYNFLQYLQFAFPKFFFLCAVHFSEIECIILRKFFFFFSLLCKYHLNFQYFMLIDIIIVDNPGKLLRFNIIYLFQSLKYNTRLRLNLYTNECIPIQSIMSLFFSAAWMERESWDMFGILFIGHTDLRRLLTDYGFLGFPLRKDFPVTGYYEIFYSDIQKRLIQQRVILIQNLRFFFYPNVWVNS